MKTSIRDCVLFILFVSIAPSIISLSENVQDAYAQEQGSINTESNMTDNSDTGSNSSDLRKSERSLVHPYFWKPVITE
jgi:hypothetical protein